MYVAAFHGALQIEEDLHTEISSVTVMPGCCCIHGSNAHMNFAPSPQPDGMVYIQAQSQQQAPAVCANVGIVVDKNRQ
jgi:hypothetical protein